MPIFVRLIFLVSIFIYAVIGLEHAIAFDLVSPSTYEVPQVLPAGIASPQFLNVSMSIESHINGDGRIEPLGAQINHTVKWNDVINGEKDKNNRSFLYATIANANLNLDGGPGSTVGQVNVYTDVKVPTLALGVTDRWMAVIAVPLVNISVNAGAGFRQSNDGRKWINKLCSMDAQQCNLAQRKMNTSVNDKLVSYGYEPLRPKTVSGLGDIQVLNKYLIQKNQQDTLSIQSKVVVPTGVAPSVDDLLGVAPGEGRYQLGATLIYGRELQRDLNWNSSASYVALLPHQVERRIPIDSNSPVSEDKELLTRQLDSIINFGTAFDYFFPGTGVTLGAGYSFQLLASTQYSGGVLFSQERYRFLDDYSPSQNLHSMILMARFSTIDWVLKKEFFYPLMLNVYYSRGLFGRNAVPADVLTGQVVLFL
jgi:hypothetical protein